MLLRVSINYIIDIPAFDTLNVAERNARAIWYENRMREILQGHSDNARTYSYYNIQVAAGPIADNDVMQTHAGPSQPPLHKSRIPGVGAQQNQIEHTDKHEESGDATR